MHPRQTHIARQWVEKSLLTTQLRTIPQHTNIKCLTQTADDQESCSYGLTWHQTQPNSEAAQSNRSNDEHEDTGSIPGNVRDRSDPGLAEDAGVFDAKTDFFDLTAEADFEREILVSEVTEA